MIVTCERCATQFQLDDARVPEGGVRVRCSRCKHAFQIEPPAHTEVERIQRLARRALEEDETPDITQDLPPSAQVGAAAAADALADDLDDEESDWEFNDDRPQEDDDLETDRIGEGDEAGLDIEDGLDSSLALDGSDPYDFGTDLDGTAESDEPADAPALEQAASAAADPSPLLGTTAVDEVPAVEDPSDALAAELGADDGDDLSDSGLDLAGDSELAEQEDAVASEDELGSPDEWEIFADDAPPVSSAADVAPDSDRRLRVAPPAAALDADESSGSGWLPRVGVVAGWVLTVALFGAGLYAAPARPGATAPLTAQDVGSLRVEQVRGVWIENAVSGPVYVVSGMVRNPSDKIARSGPLFIELLDRAGEPLAGETPLGPTIAAVTLREEDPATQRGPTSPALVERPFFPDESRPFHAVIRELPSGAVAYRFSAAGRGATTGARPR